MTEYKSLLKIAILLLIIIQINKTNGSRFELIKNIEKYDYSIIAGNETLRISDAKDILQIAFQSYEEEEDIASVNGEMNSTNPIESVISYRLPNTTLPLRYYLHITTNIHRGIFDYNGNCTIEIMVVESTDELILNALNLNIFKILIDDLTDQTSMENLSYKIQNQMLIIFDTKINEIDSSSIVKTKSFKRNHRLRLQIHYSSVISNEIVGFYQMTYSTSDGGICIGASTQFEPTYARSALPCYDEPRFKSNFTISITHGSNYTAISNMPESGNSFMSRDGMMTTSFQETPPMSVYLLAFVISNFKDTSTRTENLLQRVFYPPDFDHLNTTTFLDDAFRAIKIFESIMGVPYMLPKLDHVIVNESYGKGMENWGLITYSNKKFLNYSVKNKKADFEVLEVLTHELVHQWLGNLVTPEWWTYIWLNEGFATYYGYILIDMLRPEHNALENFQLSSCTLGRNDFDDGGITKYVETPSGIKGAFNRAVYAKAGCIIQMFEHSFGQDVFRKALSKYVKTHAFSTVNENDLFQAVQQEVEENDNSVLNDWKENVNNIMHSWTHSRSSPVIRITRNYANQSSIIHIQQQMSDESSDGPSDLYWIPLNFVTPSNNDFENTCADFFMPPVSDYSLDLATLGIDLTPENWLIVNKQGMGYYSVLYDSTNMNLITKALRADHKVIHFRNRATYFTDLSSYNTATKKSSEDLIIRLESIKYLKKEDNPFVWAVAIPLMIELENEMKCDDLAEKLMREFLIQSVMPIYRSLNTASAIEMSTENRLLLDDLEDFLCLLGVDKCLVLKKHFVMKFISGEHNDAIETTFQLCNAAKLFNEHEYQLALDFIVGQNKVDIWYGLACTRNDSLYQKLLQKIFDMIGDENNCENKLISYIELLTNGRIPNRKSTWKMLKENMPRVLAAPCADMFFDNLSKNLIYIDKGHREDLHDIYGMYFKHNGNNGIFNETLVGRIVQRVASNTKTITDVTEWLKLELKNNADKYS